MKHNMQHVPIFAFDFSMNKPAMACLIDNELSFTIKSSSIVITLVVFSDIDIIIKVDISISYLTTKSPP